MGCSRQKYWSGLPCPSPGDLPYPGLKPVFPIAPALQADFFFFLMLSHPGSPAMGETYQKLTLIPKRSDYRFFFLLSLLFSDFQYAYVLLYQIHICFLPFIANIFKKWRELNLSAFRMRVTEHLFSPENYTKPRRINQGSQPPLV